MTEELGIDGIPMELPIVQYDIVDIFNCQTPCICPKCYWRGLIETRDGMSPEDFFCMECLKNNEEIRLVNDAHWEARSVLASANGAGKSLGDNCCKEFLPGIEAIHKSCEHAALNGVGIKLPSIKYCPWCGDGPKGENESKT